MHIKISTSVNQALVLMENVRTELIDLIVSVVLDGREITVTKVWNYIYICHSLMILRISLNNVSYHTLVSVISGLKFCF